MPLPPMPTEDSGWLDERAWGRELEREREDERRRLCWDDWAEQEAMEEEERERAEVVAALWSLGCLDGLGGPPARPEDDPVSGFWRG